MASPSSVNWRTWLAGAFVASCVTGCNGMLGRQGMPGDPLFAAGKPQESKAVQAPPVLLAYAEPQVPLDPALALAKQSQPQPKMLPPDISHGSVPGMLTGRPVPSGDKTKNPPNTPNGRLP